MGQLTTHVLDTSAGLPAADVRIDVHEFVFDVAKLRVSVRTGSDGRCPAPLLAGTQLQAGRYSLTFFVADYFRSRGVVLPEPAFIDEVVIRIGIAHPGEHYHVPLLVSPWSYSIYRGG